MNPRPLCPSSHSVLPRLRVLRINARLRPCDAFLSAMRCQASMTALPDNLDCGQMGIKSSRIISDRSRYPCRKIRVPDTRACMPRAIKLPSEGDGSPSLTAKAADRCLHPFVYRREEVRRLPAKGQEGRPRPASRASAFVPADFSSTPLASPCSKTRFFALDSEH